MSYKTINYKILLTIKKKGKLDSSRKYCVQDPCMGSFTQFISFNPHSLQKEGLLLPQFSDEEVLSTQLISSNTRM